MTADSDQRGRPGPAPLRIDLFLLAGPSAHVAYVADTIAQAQDALRAAMPGWLATTAQYRRLDGTNIVRLGTDVLPPLRRSA